MLFKIYPTLQTTCNVHRLYEIVVHPLWTRVSKQDDCLFHTCSALRRTGVVPSFVLVVLIFPARASSHPDIRSMNLPVREDCRADVHRPLYAGVTKTYDVTPEYE